MASNNASQPATEAQPATTTVTSDKPTPETDTTQKPAETQTAQTPVSVSAQAQTTDAVANEDTAEGLELAGHEIPQHVLDQIETEVASTYAHKAEIFPSEDAYREYLLACYIVSLYAEADMGNSPLLDALQKPVASIVGDKTEEKSQKTAPVVYDPSKRYVVAHTAVGEAREGDIFTPGKGIDMQRLLDVGALVEAKE